MLPWWIKKELPQLLAVEVAFKTSAGLGINLLRGCLPEKIKIVPGLVLLVFPDTLFTALARILDSLVWVIIAFEA
jgi:hypothetical protein